MLHYSCEIAFHPLIMLLEILVHILHMNTLRANHLLMNSREREASFLRRISLRIIIFHDMSIIEHLAEVLILREILRNNIKIDDHYADVTTHLRGSKTNTLAVSESLPHIFNKLFQFWIVSSNILSFLAKHWLTVSINR